MKMKSWTTGDLLSGIDTAAMQREADEIVERIRPLLAGRHPAVQGVALSELVATFIAGHVIPSYREHITDLHFRTVAEMLPALIEDIERKRRRNAH